MTEYETEYDRQLNKNKDRLGLYGTLHRILIDGKKPDEHVLKAVDQIISLRRSKIWNKVANNLDKSMMEYFKLPAEEQVKTYPEVVKLYTQVGKDLKQMAEYHKRYHSNPKPAMEINNEDDKTTTVIDIDYFKTIESDVKIDFAYSNIGEIYKDKSLTSPEKANMIRLYFEAKEGKTSNIEVPNIIEVIKEASMLEEEAEMLDTLIYDGHPEEFISDDDMSKIAKSMFLTLCAKYPLQFIKAKKGKGKRVGWLKQKEGRTYRPTLITLDPIETKAYKDRIIIDSTTRFLEDAYFIKELKAFIYFVRTTKD